MIRRTAYESNRTWFDRVDFITIELLIEVNNDLNTQNIEMHEKWSVAHEPSYNHKQPFYGSTINFLLGWLYL